MPRSRSDDATGVVPAGRPGDTGSDATRAARWHLAWVAGAFLGLRAVLWATGVRFGDRLIGQLQLLDEDVLEADPLSAFTQNHIQPPLWNFTVGAVRAWSPFPAAVTFQVIWVLLGAATAFMLWDVLTRLGARRWQATVATVLVMSNPLVVSSESFLRYETPVTFLVTASVFIFARFAADPTLRRACLFAAVLLVGVATRTMLHPVWVLGGLVAMVLVTRRARRPVAPVLVPVAVVVLLIAGHQAFVHHRFGTTGPSSYSGVNLKRIAVTTLSQDTLERLQADGTLSPLASIKPYEQFERYVERDPSLAGCDPTGLGPALAEPRKGTGEANLNHVCFLPVYRQAFRDATAAIRAEPGNYVASVGRATAIFLSRPAAFDEIDTDAFAVLEAVYAPLLLPVHVDYDVGGGQPQQATGFMARGLDQLPFQVTMAVAVGLALWRGGRARWRIFRGRGDQRDPIEAWIGFTVLSVAVVGVAFDFYENARFRQALDPLLLGPLFVVVTTGIRSLVLRVRHRSGDVVGVSGPGVCPPQA